jgi:uncharacterized protein YunC (DUF1805 family)
MTEVEPENGEPQAEAQEVEVPASLKPVILGPPAYGSQDPETSGYTLLPQEDVPEMIVVDMPVTEETAPLGVTAPKDDLLDIAEQMGISEDEVNSDMSEDEIASRVLSTQNLEKMTKDELETVSQQLGQTGVSTSMTKNEMIAAIRTGGAPEEQPESDEG